MNRSLVLVLLVACARPERGETAPYVSPAAPFPAKDVASGEACALPSKPVTSRADDRNVDGAPLAACGAAPLTGFYRDGRCSTGTDDTGVHVVCSEVTDSFLQFSKAQGNDLVTPRGAFAGLKAGDRWCLCAARWQEAESAGVAPPVVIEATHEAARAIVPLDRLRAHRLLRR